MLTYVPLVLFFCASCTQINEYLTGAQDRDWTIYRGSPSLCGYTGCALPDAPQLLWSVETRTRTVAAPVVYDGWVYTLDRKGCLRRFSMVGDSASVYDFQTTIEASFVAGDSMLYAGRTDGYVNAYDINKQQVVWEFETLGQISGSPNLVDGQLLVGSYDGSMYTLDSKSGRKTGQFETGYYINGTAAVWQGYMMFGGCDKWVRVVDIATGTVTDSVALDSYVPASPAILDGVACACDYNGNVYEMKLDGGKISDLRKLVTATEDNAEQDGGVVSMPTLTRTDVFILSGDRHICCIGRSSGQVRWKKMLRGVTGECSPLVAKDRVLVCTKDGHVSILGAKDGTELWHYETGEPIVASPAVIRDYFFVLTARGTLLCFK